MEITCITKAEKNQVNEIVKIHLESFQGFFLTFMGKGFLKTLYTSYLTHKDSGIIVALEDNGIVGFLAYSANYSGLFKYMIKSRLIPFAWYSFGAFLRKPKTFMRIIRAFLKPGEVKEKDLYVELASIAVRKDYEGKGMGSKLVKEVINKFSCSNNKYIRLETDAENNEYVNNFYLKNGFVLHRVYATREGRNMNEYRYYLK